MKRINKNLLIRLISSTALLLCSALVVSAQSTKPDEYPKVEVFVGYSALGEANRRGISFGPNSSVAASYSAEPGFETSIIRNFSKHFGIKGDFSAHFNNESKSGPITGCTPGCTTVTQAFQLKTRVYNFLAGPEFKARNHTRVTPFAHVLGGAHYIRILCAGKGDQSWRLQMQKFMDLEGPPGTPRRALMVQEFNEGYREQEQRYSGCSPDAQGAENTLKTQGARYAKALAARYRY